MHAAAMAAVFSKLDQRRISLEVERNIWSEDLRNPDTQPSRMIWQSLSAKSDSSFNSNLHVSSNPNTVAL